ncbi:hypothetical protein BpHYR1_004591 [Brachionus plicatilis]|uniref:Uncharacterized protein n=1 Tax=Brachionus plicatilis TaxID=10195 RepID=A0A3M7PAZ6_BRAPC|nr:hypothetical protein BpHYR1_004591 [Brachionus plicatilis]
MTVLEALEKKTFVDYLIEKGLLYVVYNSMLQTTRILNLYVIKCSTLEKADQFYMNQSILIFLRQHTIAIAFLIFLFIFLKKHLTLITIHNFFMVLSSKLNLHMLNNSKKKARFRNDLIFRRFFECTENRYRAFKIV